MMESDVIDDDDVKVEANIGAQSDFSLEYDRYIGAVQKWLRALKKIKNCVYQ